MSAKWRRQPDGPFTVAQLAQSIGLPVPEKGADRILTDLRTLLEAESEHLSFFDNATYKNGARTTQAGAVLVRPQDADVLPPETVALITPQPYVSFALALQLFYPFPVPEPGRHQSSHVAESAKIHPSARLEPGVVVYPEASIGPRAHIGAYTVIGRGVSVGEGSVIGSHCTLLKTTVGDHCLFHAGVRTGQDGFGFAVAGTDLIKVPQVGGVQIGNHVEIGANTTIDCGALGDTIIEDHVKIDNQVQIGHNVRVGAGTRIVAQTGVAGSASLGKMNVIGGQSGIAGHIALADKVMVAARSGVTKAISQTGAVVAGLPAEPILDWRKKMAMISRMARQAKQKGYVMSKDTTVADEA